MPVPRILAAVHRHGMIAPGQTVLAAVSGGQDSVAMLHALAALRDALGARLVAAHLNHGFRGAEADDDARYVEQLATKLDVPCIVAKEDVPARARRTHRSAQEAARSARHDFLLRTASACGAERIALAHTRSDRVETILLNLLRGAGLDGLAAMPPVDLPLIRPLCDVTRDQTQAYCAEHDLRPRHDTSNDSLVYGRNRIRAELLPYLRSHFNPAVDDALLRLAELAATDSAALDSQAAAALQACTSSCSDERISLVSAQLLALPVSLQRRAVRLAITHVRGTLHGIGMEMVDAALAAAAGGKVRAFDLPAGDAVAARILVREGSLVVERVRAPSTTLPWQVELPLGEVTVVRPAGIVVRVRRVGTMPVRPFDCLYVSLHEIALPLVARSWRPGDRMRPLGLGGSKKLQDLFTDAKVAASERRRYAVLAEGGGDGRILAVLGLQRAEIVCDTAEETDQSDVLEICWRRELP